jgi:hypothetical protein
MATQYNVGGEPKSSVEQSGLGRSFETVHRHRSVAVVTISDGC